MIRLRDTRGRFISTHNHDDIIDAEVIEDTSTELVVRPQPTLPTLPPEPDSLPDLLIAEALDSVEIDRDVVSGFWWIRQQEQFRERLTRAVTVIERLYPEMAQATGVERDFTFDPALITAKTQARQAVQP